MAYKICINAGHARGDNEEHGACYYGLRECDITYDVATDVVQLLTEKGFDVQLVQDDSLQGICDKANGFQSNLFVSLHCNAFSGPASGTEVFWYKGSRAETAGLLIRRNICNTLNTVERFNTDGSHLYVLKHTAMPAVLVEMFFISSKEDLEKYNNNKKGLAEAIANGIESYFK